MATCGDCDAEVWWKRTESGAKMPIDPRRVPGGNIEIRDDVAHVVRGEPEVARYTSHYATCPYEIELRKALKNAHAAERERIKKKQLGLFGK